MAEHSIYTVGGTVQAGNGVYIPRRADEQLLELCRSRTFAYVLTPRQMGKSSLMVQTAAQLQEEGICTAIIDLQPIGAKVSPEEWYLGLLTELEDQLDLDTDLLDWWEAHTHLGLAQRMTRFFSAIVLAEIDAPLVVFIDEIDTTLSLDFTDDFFIALRYFYTARAQNPEFSRLSFVLIGVATPADLIRDPQRTPFNVGQRVDLTDFTPKEAQPLAAGLGLPPSETQQILIWVLDWTGGHPYLTQRLFQAVVESIQNSFPTPLTPSGLDHLVTATFFGGMSERDNNLQFVRDMLTHRAPDVYQVLTTYQDIWRGRQQVEDEEQSLIKSHLKLSGVVKQEDDKTLRVRNAIYEQVFDETWIRENLPVNWRKRIRQLQGVIAAGLLITFTSSGFAGWALWERQRAEKETQKARDFAVELENQNREVERQKKLAEERGNELAEALKATQAAQMEAEAKRKEAESAQEFAEQTQQSETQQRQRAESALQRAEAGEAEANRQTTIAQTQTRIAEENAEDAKQSAELARTQTRIAEAATQEAEIETFNADIRADSLTIENLMAANFNFKAFLAGLALGQRIQREAVPASTNSTPASVSLTKNTAKPNTPTATPLKPLRPEIRLQAAAALHKIYNFNGYLQRNTLASHTDGVRSVSFAPDGQTLASASSDGTVKLWDRSGRELQTFEGHTDRVWSVSFAPDGQTLASASSDGRVILWNFDLDDLMAKSCGWLRDYMTNPATPDDHKA
ncbi:MAG: hypothetical protein F6K42_24050, partial [Leptolyngbya sp. SIO1D8]|nr:hypothetical protein [Leptolyngbya sp. SIO1D8]